MQAATSGAGATNEAAESATHTGCVDKCCPSVVVNDQGKMSIHVPPASIVTTLGGLCLIAVHAGNLCCCAGCKKKKKKSAEG